MAEFLAEVYTPKLDRPGLEELIGRLEAAVEGIEADGDQVRYVRSIHVPEDEMCFHLFECDSAELVRKAGRYAGLAFDRVAAAVASVNLEGGSR